MRNTFKDYLKNLSKNRLLTKYLLYTLIFAFIVMLCGQLIAQLFTVRQLNKISGKIIKKEVSVTSYTSGDRWKRGRPNHSLVVKLDNGQSYDIELENDNRTIDKLLSIGDSVTIYYPSITYNVLSLDILDFGGRVSQVESNNRVLYSFDHHKHEAWSFIYFLILAPLPFAYFLYDWYKNDPNRKT